MHSQASSETLPVIVAGAMPSYPLIAVHAHIEGVVKIKVTTNGEAISNLESISGPAMLVAAARETIQTWKFVKHHPTQFVASFTYRISGTAHCEFTNPTIVTHLPLEVEITSDGLQTCDPSTTIKTKPKY